MSGKRLGDYEILDQLGEGGMGAVFRARHERLEREVALKVLREGTVENEEHARRFQREMHIAGGLSHPNLVKILDGGTLDGVAYIAMELVDGLTLTNTVNRWAPFPWPVALAIGSRIADGLAFLHERGILHRDVKPSNILISYEGFVKLLDFGLARGHNATVMTQEGAVVGTLQFLSPEILTGEDASPMTDMWAVGCVMYLMLTGRMHVMAEEFKDWCQSIVNDPIPPPGAIVPTIPSAASQLVVRMLSREPKQRPASAAATRDEIDRILLGVGGTTWDRVLVPGILVQLEEGTFKLDSIARTPSTVVLETVTDAREAPTGDMPSRSSSRKLSQPLKFGAVSRSTKVPVRRRGLHPLVLALPSLVAALLAIGYFWRPVQAPTPGASPSVSDEAPAASGLPMLDPSVKSAFARKLVPWLPRLKSGGPTAKRTVEEVRHMSPVDFGLAPDNWIFWIEFEQWIAQGAHSKMPKYRSAEQGVMGYLDERMALSWLQQLGKDLSPQLIVTAYRGVGGTPDDGRCWLAMARAFDLEGRSADAVMCYRTGLDRLKELDPLANSNDLLASNEFLFTAVARALTLVPGKKLERDWFDYLPDRECRTAWTGLIDAVNGDKLAVEKIVRYGLSHPMKRVTAAVVLEQALFDRGGDNARLRKLVFESLGEHPDVQTLRDVLYAYFHYTCERGRLDDAAELARRTGKSDWKAVLGYLSDGPSCPELPWRNPADAAEKGLLVRMEVVRQLELGHLTDAQTLAEVLKTPSPEAARVFAPILVELVGQGSTSPWIEVNLGQLLLDDPPDLALWNDAAGGLSSPAGLRAMGQWLTPGGRTIEQAEGWRDVMRALWLSRRGKHAEALDALQRASDLFGKEMMPSVEVTEILARPLIDAKLGVPQSPAVLERTRAFTIPTGVFKHIVEPYMTRLRTSDFRRAADHAYRQFEWRPEFIWWPLAMCLHARINGNAEELKDARARLAATARWHGCGRWALEAAGR